MLRITRTDDEHGEGTRLRLEGRLTAGALSALDSAWRRCLAERRAVVIDLAGVRFVDGAGASWLRALRAGAAITGCSPFVRELLEEERP
jgi:anti-anti-sigma regulatory factor